MAKRRRQEPVQKKRKPPKKRARKILRGVSLAVIVLAIMAGCVFLFKAETVVVEGTSRYTDAEIVAASGVTAEDNLLLLSRTAVSERIMDRLPYVQDVVVRRKLPDTLYLTVDEASAAGLVYDGETLWIISPNGRVTGTTPLNELTETGPWIDGLTVQPTSREGAPLVVAEDETERFAHLLILLRALDDNGLLADTTGINCKSSATLIFDWGHRFTVIVPADADMDYKMRYFISVMDILEDSEAGKIDLTRDEAHFIPKQIS